MLENLFRRDAMKIKSALTIVALGVVAASSQAANTVNFAGAGSSNMFFLFEAAVGSYYGVGPGNEYRSTGQSAGIVHDGAHVDQKGDIWVIWDGGSANSRRISYYISVDSTV